MTQACDVTGLSGKWLMTEVDCNGSGLWRQRLVIAMACDGKSFLCQWLVMEVDCNGMACDGNGL
jgi:hypothetical protein